VKKIVIIGPESTGKSTLCEQLAEHYKTSWCPEYAREYLLKNGTDYSFGDLLTIAKGQVALEEKTGAAVKKMEEDAVTGGVKVGNRFTEGRRLTAAPLDHPFFIDTDMYVMKVWCEVVFQQCHTWILKQIAMRQYDFYFLCFPDLPWVKDELREYPDPHIRKKLYNTYKDIVVNSGTPWAEISGQGMERFQVAVQILNTVFPVNKVTG